MLIIQQVGTTTETRRGSLERTQMVRHCGIARMSNQTFKFSRGTLCSCSEPDDLFLSFGSKGLGFGVWLRAWSCGLRVYHVGLLVLFGNSVRLKP